MGYEPDELPTALLRDIQKWLGAGGRTRTGTVLLPGDFKSPVSTIPPHRRRLATVRISHRRDCVNPFSEKPLDRKQHGDIEWQKIRGALLAHP